MLTFVQLACGRAPCAYSPVQDRVERIPDGMAEIAGGTFAMGSDDDDANANERPVHPVDVATFYLDKTETSVAAYHACVAAGRCTPPDPFVNERRNFHIFCNWDHPEGRALHPVNCVDWQQAAAYCAAVGKRLPTEQEWEYAARGGNLQRKYPWGNERPTERLLNACGTECPDPTAARGFPGWPPMYPASDGWPETAPVGSFPAGSSRDGVLDLAGNVWEWTDSAYSEYSRTGASSSGSTHDATRSAANEVADAGAMEPKRVMRGGSWGGGDPRTERTTNRFKLAPSSRSQFLGFRCACLAPSCAVGLPAR